MLSRLLYAPFLAHLVVTRRCNLACGYCNEYDAVSKPVPTGDLEQRLDELEALGTWGVDLTGGEPLMHPDIVHLVRYAKKVKRFHKVMLLSNGYLFSKKVVHQLNDAGLDALQISVDGVRTNEVTVKVLEPLRKKLITIAEHAKFAVTLSGVIGSAPTGEATEVARFAAAHGFTPRVLLLHDGTGQMQLSAEQLAEYRDIGRSIGGRFREAGDYRNRLLTRGRAPFKCRSGSRYLYVDEFGVVHWCSQTREAFGIPLAEYTRADLKRQFHTRKDCSDHCTIGCARTCSSVDGWRRQHLEPEPAREHPDGLVRLLGRKRPRPTDA